ncbi:MAG: type I-B CRISPR-associated protein Cas7/Cst2/DevR [Candidatus Tenebribacter mawsonii]|nr:type I-B CRISPR-associated protein Cas7/Cst2/DevR [Candidatus Tenebribacter mawsonii]
MNKELKSLTITYLSKVSFASLNGSDSDVDNINTIKKITLENKDELPYVSSQAIRRALRDQLQNLGWKLSEITGDKDSKHPPKTQCDPTNFIDDDLFGFMDAQKETNKRTSPIRVESLISLSKYQGDLDFGTNFMGMEKGINPNIYETEIHSGIYRGTILIELDRIGKGEGFENELSNDEKTKRVNSFIDAFQNLWSSGRQSRFLADISPKFFAAAIMYSKNPIFLEAVKEPIKISELESVKNDYSDFIKEHCFAAQKSIFDKIDGECLTLKDGFEKIKNWVKEYYGK